MSLLLVVGADTFDNQQLLLLAYAEKLSQGASFFMLIVWEIIATRRTLHYVLRHYCELYTRRPYRLRFDPTLDRECKYCERHRQTTPPPETGCIMIV